MSPKNKVRRRIEAHAGGTENTSSKAGVGGGLKKVLSGLDDLEHAAA